MKELKNVRDYCKIKKVHLCKVENPDVLRAVFKSGKTHAERTGNNGR